jgi:hypothetical protein
MLKDIRGRRIEVGSKVVWPGRRGSSLWMTAGEVVSIKKVDGPSWTDQVRHQVRVQITHVDSDYSWDVKRIGTSVTLTRVDNIVVVG